MEASQTNPSLIQTSPTHPLLLVAAASVTLLSLAGAGVLAGWLPGPGSRQAEPAKLVAALPAAPIPVPRTASVPRDKIKPAATPGAQPATHTAPRATPVEVATAPAVAVPPAPSYGGSPSEPAYRVATPLPAVCNECGVVETVREIAVEPSGSGGGAIAGGLVGGLIANQIGKGATRSIATVLGAAGGAYAGNYIEKSMKDSKRYEVVVRFEDDSTRTFGSATPPAWRSGDRVRLQNGLLTMGGGRSNGNPATI